MKLGRQYRLLLVMALAAGSLFLMRPAAAIDTVYVDDGIVTGHEGEAGTSAAGKDMAAKTPEQTARTAAGEGSADASGKGAADMARSADPRTLELQIRADEAAAQRAFEAAEEAKANAAYLEAEARYLEARQKREEERAERERQDALLKAERESKASEKKNMEARESANRKVEQEQKRAVSKARFQEIGRDKDYVYYMDMKTARYVQPARSTSERVIDVWVKLVEQPVPAMANPDELTEHYYLEHYYVSSQRKAIQFLSELEVAGRPQNAVRDRAYRVDQWERLIPGSSEETIYRGVVAKMREATMFGGRGSLPSLRDMVEEYLRISL
ncbi:hypothetical protein TAMA11512_23810 [Selenomonas sp. TAMA-11512]|uniref:hypothetical protein n=1 Tax=Selenomonas sp. TAMA-11512 TaxID=3095337 RepID=UPI0030872F23|nr:hypothetical protein TAMA11512_23810 [Selenomonas sp. TAMA-11512]